MPTYRTASLTYCVQQTGDFGTGASPNAANFVSGTFFGPATLPLSPQVAVAEVIKGAEEAPTGPNYPYHRYTLKPSVHSGRRGFDEITGHRRGYWPAE